MARSKPKFKVTDPEFASLLKEYVDYANEHRDEIVERVVPQTGRDVLETYEEILPAIRASLEIGMGEWEE
jgi:DNA-binding ferritin-like protein